MIPFLGVRGECHLRSPFREKEEIMKTRYNDCVLRNVSSSWFLVEIEAIKGKKSGNHNLMGGEIERTEFIGGSEKTVAIQGLRQGSGD
jgi:hypothetical protein